MTTTTTNEERLRGEVWRALNALGTTASEVAMNLQKRGVKGHIGCSGICPIANYLATKGYDAKVGSGMIAVRSSVDGALVEWMLNVGTSPIHDFVKRFDAGTYPNLVDTA